MIQIPKFIKDTLKYFQYEGSPNPTTQDDLQAFMKSDHSVLECLVDGLWQPETYYKENHVVRSPNMQAGFVAKVTKAGTSGSNEPDWGGATATDGTVKWKIQKQGSGGSGATWESSTFYNVDSTVSLEGNSSFFLLCIKSGTSGATQPTVSSEANVTDGSVTWKPIYYKKLPTLDSSNYIKGENLAGYWKASQSVTVGTIRFLHGDKYAGYYLKCTTAGTTGTVQPTPVIPTTGVISDGSAKWQLVDNTSLIGEIKVYSGDNVPIGWLICDGSAINRTTYSALFSVIGTKYGNGNGTTTFNLPDLSDIALGTTATLTNVPAGSGYILKGTSNYVESIYAPSDSGYAIFSDNGGTSITVRRSSSGGSIASFGRTGTVSSVNLSSLLGSNSVVNFTSGSVKIKYIIKY